MKKYNAMSIIEILLILLVFSIMAMVIAPIFKENSFNNQVERANIKENVDNQIKEIQKIKDQNIKMMENINQDY